MKRFILALGFIASAHAQCTGYGYQRAITVQTSQVTGTLTNFPMLVLNPTTSLKTVANGGRLTSSSGYDVVFQTSGGSALPFELVGHGGSSTTYSATTGDAEFWVKVSSIADGTVIYMCYGNAAVTTYQGNDTSTWSGYKNVLHSPNGTTLSVYDSAVGSNATNGAGANAVLVGTGQIDGGGDFTGTKYIDTGTALNALPITISYWVKPANFTSYYALVGSSANSNGPELDIEITTGFVRANKQNVIGIGNSTTALTAAAWNHVAFTYDGSGNYAYLINGAAAGSGTNIQALTFSNFWWGSNNAGGSGASGASAPQMDELHTAGSVLTSGWLTTEYKNQSAPGSFYAVGSETSPSVAAFTASPTAVPANNAADIVVSLTGTGTSWTSSSRFTLSGVSGTACAASPCVPTVSSGTSATITLTTGATTGTLTITESVTGTAVGTMAVGLGGSGICASVGGGL